MKKIVRTALITVGIILLAGVILYIICVITGNNYSVVEERDYGRSVTLTPEQIDKIFKDIDLKEFYLNEQSAFYGDESWVINFVVDNVAKEMHFATKNDLPHMRGNCEGQAMVCSAAINYALRQCGISDCYAKPVIVQAYLYGINANKVLSAIVPAKDKHFVVNHCVVKVHHADGDEEYFDTSIPFGLTPKKRK